MDTPQGPRHPWASAMLTRIVAKSLARGEFKVRRFYDIPRGAFIVVALIWIGNVLTGAAAVRLDPQFATLDIWWQAFFFKRGMSAVFWMAISVLALLGYHNRPVGLEKLGRSLVTTAGIAAIVMLSYLAWHAGAISLINGGRQTWSQSMALLGIQDALYAYFMAWQIAIAANAYHYYRRMMSKERESERLQLQLAKTELMLFRAQLEPHFVFNALNSIASLVRLHRGEAAIDALHQLSSLLRSVLEAGNRQVMPWHWEKEFSQMYVALQKLRFADQLQVEFDVEGIAPDTPIPILLLQPLIENAIHHGPLAIGKQCKITIQLRDDQNRIRLQVSNALINHRQAHRQHHGKGVGLGNIAARLRGIYADDYQFSYCQQAGEFVVNAEFPASVAATSEAEVPQTSQSSDCLPIAS